MKVDIKKKKIVKVSRILFPKPVFTDKEKVDSQKFANTLSVERNIFDNAVKITQMRKNRVLCLFCKLGQKTNFVISSASFFSEFNFQLKPTLFHTAIKTVKKFAMEKGSTSKKIRNKMLKIKCMILINTPVQKDKCLNNPFLPEFLLHIGNGNMKHRLKMK